MAIAGGRQRTGHQAPRFDLAVPVDRQGVDDPSQFYLSLR
jgi:hypothetical protein